MNQHTHGDRSWTAPKAPHLMGKTRRFIFALLNGFL